MPSLIQRVADLIRARQLFRAGDRVAAGVSGGGDSVGLFRLLLELREQLGLVLSVAHFHHGIRGLEADRDEAFVASLARNHDLEFHLERGDAQAWAREQGCSLESAARELRLRFFKTLLAQRRATRIATAHTLDDQAETVLMKALRGAGTRGLSGIFPEQRLEGGSIVRPLLEVRREEIREYLRSVNQAWREDASNEDLGFKRNRVRLRVMPVLRKEMNPCADEVLAHLAEIARGEEEYWAEQVKRLLPFIIAPGEPARGGGRRQTSSCAIALDIQKLQHHQTAVQRRLLHAAGEQVGCRFELEHVQAILDLLSARVMGGREGKTVQLEGGWHARLLFRELRIEKPSAPASKKRYQYVLPIPGRS